MQMQNVFSSLSHYSLLLYYSLFNHPLTDLNHHILNSTERCVFVSELIFPKIEKSREKSSFLLMGMSSLYFKANSLGTGMSLLPAEVVIVVTP